METTHVPRELRSIARILQALPPEERQEAQARIHDADLSSLEGAVAMALHSALKNVRGKEAADTWLSESHPPRYTQRDVWLRARREGSEAELFEQGFVLPDETMRTARIRLARLAENRGTQRELQLEEKEVAQDLVRNSGIPGMTAMVAEALGVSRQYVSREYGGGDVSRDGDA